MIWALVVAGGSGLRMQSAVRKQYIDLEGRPILAHTLLAVDRCTALQRIVLVVPAGDVDDCRQRVVAPLGLTHEVQLVAGGAHRQASVQCGLAAVDDDDGMVMIHDGVRPFISPSLMDACLGGCRISGACIPVLPAAETLKKVAADGTVVATLDREQIQLAQTPQTFSVGLIRRAHHIAEARGFLATDDASVAESVGATVTVVPGERENIKITTPHDLLLARAILEHRRGRG